jgi:hypothetical protein
MDKTMPKAPVEKTFKNCNITLVADGLSTSIVHSQFFPELGPAKSAVQIPPVATLDFGNYTFLVEVQGRRAIASDVSGELSPASPIVAMMKRFVREAKGATISALGFNFAFELAFEEPAIGFTMEKFLQVERMKGLGKSLLGGGFKIIAQRDDHVLQVAYDPVWEKPLAVAFKVNYHFNNAGDRTWGDILDRFASFTGDAPRVLDEISRD